MIATAYVHRQAAHLLRESKSHEGIMEAFVESRACGKNVAFPFFVQEMFRPDVSAGLEPRL